MNNGEKTCHQVKSYKICCKSSFNVKSTENTVKDTRFTQISTIFNPSHCSTSRRLNIEIALILENQRKESLVLRKHIFGNLSSMTYVSESELRSESSQNRDALKNLYITYLFYPLGYFLPSSILVKKWGKIKNSNFLNLTPSILAIL